MFSERLKLARKRSGFSLRELSDRLDYSISAQAIGKYERGEMMPSSGVALKLAKSLDVSMSYLFSPSDAKLESVEFRKSSKSKARERSIVEAAVLDQVDRYLSIEEILDIGSHEWKKPNDKLYKIESLSDAEEVAEDVRIKWNLGGDAIPNMTDLLEEKGVKVLKVDIPLSVDGISCEVVRPNKEKVPVIVGAKSKSFERRRFTLAHELGHMLLNVADGLNEEKACNLFASALLMPRDALLMEIGERRKAFGYEELIQVKKIFGVSAASLVVRMNSLNVITEASMTKIFKGIGSTWRTREPSPLELEEEPKRFERLVYRALAEDLISLPKAAELLGRKISYVQRVMSGPAE